MDYIVRKMSELWPYFGRIINLVSTPFKAVLSKAKGMSMSGILITLGIIATAAILGIGSSYYLGDDNIVEEAAEKVIEDHSGISIDLSPSSPEAK
jgi:hypothetical protein